MWEVDVGRDLNLRANLAVARFATLFLLTASAGVTGDADAQTVPTISLDTPLAKDVDTFETDKKLDAACRKTGLGNSICLCVTHIMKYELTLSEYRVATRLYGQSADRTALHKTLEGEGYSPPEIKMAEDMETFMIEDPDFAIRCAEAKAYYKDPAT